ncbi:MAG: ribosome recycling factor [Candidatus Omnitrophica bacterium]|nr:ribosome recycling factor [Candidatus Omnitrophota bacterium]MDD5488309.1 ribosome recycling factor [Candidatus Omnitrophota bacterium]
MLTTETDRIVRVTEEKMQGALDAVKKHFATVRTGRAHPGLVEHMKVDYYGTMTPLKQLANISVPEPRLIVIQPWDKASMSMVEKAILSSDLGITPMNDGRVIRLSMPQLTEERRQELVKVLHKMEEEGKVSIRNARHNANDEAAKLEKDKKMTEDDKFLTRDRVQKLTEQYSKKLDELFAEKQKEIKG